MKKAKLQKGFTLIEMMVALMLFSVVATTGAGALLKIIDAGKKTQTLKDVSDNLNFGLETMSREMRMGSDFHCGSFTSATIDDPHDCQNGDTTLAFLDTSGNWFVYKLDSNNKSIMKSEDGGTTYAPLTAPSVTITNLTFYVEGAENAHRSNNPTIPRVIIYIQGYATQGKERLETDFNLQTSVTQRFSN